MDYHNRKEVIHVWVERRRYMRMRDQRRLFGSPSTSPSPGFSGVVTPFQIYIPSHGRHATGPYSGGKYPRVGGSS